MKPTLLTLLLFTFLYTCGRAQEMRWEINEKETGVVWDVANETRLQPRMPEGWKEMALRSIFAFGQKQGFDVEVSRSETKLMIRVKDGLTGETVFSQRAEEGEAVEVSLPY